MRENLWKGMNVTSSSGCVMVDLLSYDDSLVVSTVLNSTKSRREGHKEW